MGSIREKNSSDDFFCKYIEPLTEFPPETLFKGAKYRELIFLIIRYFILHLNGKKMEVYFEEWPTSSNVTKKQYANFYNFEKEYNNVTEKEMRFSQR